MESFDVVIAGGGPAGSAAGTWLARAGLRTLILERDAHPRFRIGESLLPYGNDLLRELGVWEKVAAEGVFMPKPGAEFGTADGEHSRQFWFATGLGPEYGSTFQVERSRFDALLFAHAAESGCTVHEHAPVRNLTPAPDGVTVQYGPSDAPREVRADWFIDATGRDAVTARSLALPKIPTQTAMRIATYAHFEGVTRSEQPAEGCITISRLPAGWFWFIPLDAGKTSVGFVQGAKSFQSAGLSPAASFEAAVAGHAGLANRMRDAVRVGEFHTTGDYSYRVANFAPHPRILLTGDAAGFVDPIFSSGVLLALKSARAATRRIIARRGRSLSPLARWNHTREMRRMLDLYTRMIAVFYDRSGFEILMDPQPVLDIPRAVAAVVGGNTDLSAALKWRLEAFYLLARLQRRLPIAPRIPYLAASA